MFLFPVFMFLLFMGKISNTPELPEHNVVKQYKVFVWLISYFFLLLFCPVLELLDENNSHNILLLRVVRFVYYMKCGPV